MPSVRVEFSACLFLVGFHLITHIKICTIQTKPHGVSLELRSLLSVQLCPANLSFLDLCIILNSPITETDCCTLLCSPSLYSPGMLSRAWSGESSSHLSAFSDGSLCCAAGCLISETFHLHVLSAFAVG